MKRGCKRKDYAGQVFNKLTIIEDREDRVSSNGINIRYVLCKCECGVEKEIRLCDVVSQSTKSCGGKNCRNYKNKKKKGNYVGKTYNFLTIINDDRYKWFGGVRVINS